MRWRALGISDEWPRTAHRRVEAVDTTALIVLGLVFTFALVVAILATFR